MVQQNHLQKKSLRTIQIHGAEGLGPIHVPENILSIPIYNFGSIVDSYKVRKRFNDC